MNAVVVFLGVLSLLLHRGCHGVEPNFEDVDLSADMPQNEKVEVIQEQPHSNAIHVAHNIPTGSDIYVKQANPYNASVHISLNIAKDCQVKVDMESMVNCNLHVSLNGASNSLVEVNIKGSVNSSVHLSFQNPVNTPVTLTVDDATLCSIHVSQNVPMNSPMDVTINGATANKIHCSQSVPQSSPLTFTLDGTIQSSDENDENDGSANQVVVSQSAPDDASPLQCTPECPEPEFNYEYDYYGNGDGSNSSGISDTKSIGSNNNLNTIGSGDGVVQQSFQNNRKTQVSSTFTQQSSSSSSSTIKRQQSSSNNLADPNEVETEHVLESSNQDLGHGLDGGQGSQSHDGADPDTPYSDSALPPSLTQDQQAPGVNDDYNAYNGDIEDYVVPTLEEVGGNSELGEPHDSTHSQSEGHDISTKECPGGSLDVCIDVCPGSHPKAFALCVAECGERCP